MRHQDFVFRGEGVAAIAAPDITAEGSEVKRGEKGSAGVPRRSEEVFLWGRDGARSELTVAVV